VLVQNIQNVHCGLGLCNVRGTISCKNVKEKRYVRASAMECKVKDVQLDLGLCFSAFVLNVHCALK
jgi:hypothetical protein